MRFEALLKSVQKYPNKKPYKITNSRARMNSSCFSQTRVTIIKTLKLA